MNSPVPVQYCTGKPQYRYLYRYGSVGSRSVTALYIMEEFDDLLQAPDDSGYLDLSHRAWQTLDNVLWTWGQSLLVLNISYNNVKEISGGIGELSLLR